MLRQISLVMSAVATLGFGVAAQAQEQSEFIKAFSGQWFVFDPQYGANDLTCTLALAGKPSDEAGTLAVEPKNCVEPLANVVTWGISDGQLAFKDASGTGIATLGGSQQRVTGELAASGRGLVVERAQGDENTRKMAAAIGRHRCIYVGFTQECADPDDLRKPAMTEDNGTFASVGIVVNLNVRDQPRSNAPIVGTLPTGACLKVNYCTQASDGIWCRARFGERSGWVHKTALRKGEWPVLTYRNSCPEPAE